MRYDENSDDARQRRDDEQRPARDQYGEPPRSRQPSRPSPSDDNSRMPSRPRGDGNSRPRGEDNRDNPPPQRRPRDDDSDQYASQRRDASSRQRPSNNYDNLRNKGRELGRRVRDGMSSMYEAMSREMHSVRDNMHRGSSRDTSEEEHRSSPRPASRSLSRSRDDSQYAPSHDDRNTREPAIRRDTPHAHPVIDNGKHGRALVVRLRRRRQIVRGGSAESGKGSATWGIALFTIFLAFIVGTGGYLGYYSASLTQTYNDSILLVAQNKDFSSTNIYDRNGVLLYSAFNHSDKNAGIRYYLNYCQIPEEVKRATVDTEDSSFWSNPGVNFTAELRALYVDTTSHGAILGASTITQQVVKTMVLNDNQKNVQRKLDEALIALDIGKIYSKQQILTSYLNQINYGSNIYGIEAAARTYFDLAPKKVSLLPQDYAGLSPDEQAYVNQINLYTKSNQLGGTPCIQQGQTSVLEPAAWQLQPWQAALLAGVPQSPNNLNPFLHPLASLARMQTGVLPNILKNGDQPYFLVNGKADTTPQDIYNAAYAAIHMPGTGDPASYQRQIFYQDTSTGNNRELAPFFVDYVISQLSSMIPNGFDQIASSGWNIYTTLDYGDPTIPDSDLNKITVDRNTGQLTGLPPDELKRVGLEQYAEFIVKRNIEGTTNYGIPNSFPDYWYCGNNSSYVVKWESSATNPINGRGWCLEQSLNQPLNKGGENVYDGALSAIDPRNGDILAMVGGVDYNSSSSMAGGQNNVTTSGRSLGSSFKPLVYATAFEMGWNPGIVIRDQPTCFPNSSTGAQPAADQFICGNHYVPHNYSPSEWAGPQPLTYLLGNSLNPPAEMTLNFTGLRNDNSAPFPNMAQRLGVTTLNPTQFGPTTALGAQNVELLEQTSAYGTFAAGGVRHPQRAILTITTATGDPIIDQSGQQLFKYDPNPLGYQAVSSESAYMVTSILTNNDARVGDFGPNTPLNYYGRQVAAKTGTSQNVVDIVTMGYTPWLALGVWAGNADGTPMKQNIIGIAGAAYIFNAVMNFAIDHYNMPGTKPGLNAPTEPGGYFPIPADMHYAQVSCNTGMAFYPGEDPTKECNPQQSPVPYMMSPDYSGNVFDTKSMSPFTYTASNVCVNWGCLKPSHEVPSPYPGYNYAWLINGQDPTTP